MTSNEKSTPRRDPWDIGTLGRDADHVRQASPEQEAQLDDALELQMISIRLQKKLLETLKVLAKVNGVGYQPLIRDVLHRFVEQELKAIARDVIARRKREDEERAQREAQERDAAESQATAMVAAGGSKLAA